MPAGAILDGLEHALKRATTDLDVPEMTSTARELMDTRSRTLLMTFDEQGRAYEIQRGPLPKPKAGGWASAIVGRVAGNPGYHTASARDREQVYNAGPNGFVVFHGDLGTLSLPASDAQKNAARCPRASTKPGPAAPNRQLSKRPFLSPAGACCSARSPTGLLRAAGAPRPRGSGANRHRGWQERR